MNDNENEKVEAEINTIRQSTIALHKFLTKRLAEEFGKNKPDEDGFVKFKSGGVGIDLLYTCDGWTMKKFIDKGDATVVLPYFRLRLMNVTIYSWIHELGPTETANLAYHVIHN